MLALVCVFAMFSCGNDDNETTTKTPEEYITSAVASSSPTKITSNVNYKDGGTTYGGRFELLIEGNNSILNYTYSRPAEIEDMHDSILMELEGTVYHKDGKYTVKGDEYDGNFTGATGFTLNLVKENFKSYNVVQNDNGSYTLTAVVTGDKVDTVFGCDLMEQGDVTVVITANTQYLETIKVTYKTASGASVSVDSTYTYTPVTLNFE